MITPAGKGGDHFLAMRTERLPQQKDVLRQVRLFDNGVRPHRAKQRLFRERPSRVLHHENQQVECFGGQRYGLAGPQQFAPSPVHNKLAKL